MFSTTGTQVVPVYCTLDHGGSSVLYNLATVHWLMVAPVYNVTTIKLVTAATTYNCYIQYNLVKQPPSVQPDFGIITSLAIN